jgi:hypothetical protein
MVLRVLRNTKVKALDNALAFHDNKSWFRFRSIGEEKYALIFLKHLTRDNAVACDEKNGLRFLAKHKEIASHVPRK